jgi:hypothetical protein
MSISRTAPPDISGKITKTVYVLLKQTAFDAFPVTCVTEKEEQAQNYNGRISDVIAVTLKYTPRGSPGAGGLDMG